MRGRVKSGTRQTCSCDRRPDDHRTEGLFLPRQVKGRIEMLFFGQTRMGDAPASYVQEAMIMIGCANIEESGP
jgi:hypothetical protein